MQYRTVITQPMRIIRFLLKQHPVATLALLISIVLILFFTVRFVEHASRPVEPDLAPWMSPRFVAKSWNLPKQVIFDVMEIDGNSDRDTMPRTLSAVMERTGLTLEQLQGRVESAVEQDQQQQELPGQDGDPR